MMNQDSTQAILSLKEKGIPIREISRILQVSRNTVRRVLRGKGLSRPQRASRYEELAPLIQETLKRCKGNAVRVKEILLDTYGHEVPYSTLTRMVRDMELREDKRTKRSGTYEFGPGEEMQHDTSPHQVILGEKKVKAQCASLVLAYSRKLFIQYYPAFSRFEAKVFLREAFLFMDGACSRCTIDNTSVIVAHGSGPDAEMAPEMERFGQIFGVRFIPHAVGDADRKARVERNFSYVEELKKRAPGRAIRQMRKLLALKRTYPAQPFLKAIEQALQYGMVDLARLEQIILSHVAGDFFNIQEDDDS